MKLKETGQIALGGLLGLALAFLAVMWVGCVGASATADARVRSALDMVAIVVDPAYGFAVDACAARQGAIAEDVEAGRMTPAQSAVVLKPIRERCHATREAFDAIRAGHAQASQLVEAGELERAEALLDEIRARWAELKGDAR